ncbi:uncharacterized protein DUF3857 [Mucilaginibacter gracilis]|uniref:Uncharacterized protein DUF3857 n=1 Tax=Mucilaginibacter gracilis TaxID=423350 RepID=A0A495J534_9SPHI|nr:DUF3857 domain-containing protein [Mucilaginibacter gracilis]RKR83464.1 uncharacterized protein DUF3857 [Mucilaginibacter gracilis]
MKLSLLFSLALLTSLSLFAQDKMPYSEKAAQLQKEIWGTTVPEFKSTTIPANLTNESAVVMARSYSSQRSSAGKFKYLIITATVTTRTTKINTMHERVKINDKVALENYSTLEYQKKLDKSVSLLITSFKNSHNTYIGAKIVKPDGKEIIVNTSEEVLTKNETKDQKGKLAIPGLQVGDILDYYVCNMSTNETNEGNTYKDNDDIFILADEYPVLYYNIDFQFNKKVNVRYIYANGAPHFTVTRNADGDLLLSLTVKNMAKYQSQLWMVPLRQYPYIEIGSSYTGTMDIYGAGDKKISSGPSMLDGNESLYIASFKEYPGFDEAEKKLKEYFKSGKALKNAPQDSVMKILYDEWKYLTFCSYQGNELESVRDLNYRRANSRYAALNMSMILTDMKISHDVILVSSRNSNTLENVYNMSDFSAMIRINGDTPTYMAFDDVTTHFNEIPAQFQGEKAVEMHVKRRSSSNYSATYSDIVLPVTASHKNYMEETLQVSLLPTNMQKLKINRTVKQAGSLRHDAQRKLIPVQDVDNSFMTMVNGEPLAKRLSRDRDTKKMKEDYAFSFNKEREEMSKNFSNEIKEQFDQEPQQLSNYKIVNPALENDNPVFQFSASFVLDNLVKKAGSNYIIDAGKLTGSFLTLTEKDKVRSIDVYMPSARTFKYNITIEIPAGFSAKGVEEMNQKKANKTGSFTSVASVKGNMLTITLSRSYTNNFEKAADWPLVKELIATASAFNDQKILLEKI